MRDEPPSGPSSHPRPRRFQRSSTPDLEAIRTALEAERARLQQEAVALDAAELLLAGAQRAEGGVGGDSADIASDLAAVNVDEALERAVRQRLADVDAVLERLENGTYGHCEECGEPIDPARLHALPWARRCLSCQRRVEREFA